MFLEIRIRVGQGLLKPPNLSGRWICARDLTLAADGVVSFMLKSASKAAKAKAKDTKGVRAVMVAEVGAGE